MVNSGRRDHQSNSNNTICWRKKIVLSSLSILLSIITVSIGRGFSQYSVKGPYLGQKSPGLKPEIFAPGIISTKAPEQCIAFAPEGRELFFVRETGDIRKIFFMKDTRTGWTPPHVVSFSGKYDDAEFGLSPDGNKLAFISKRPLDRKGIPINNWDIWIVEKSQVGWGEPEYPGADTNTDRNEVFPSFSSKGDLYFSSDRDGNFDIYISRYVDGRFQLAEKLGSTINSKYGEWDQAVAPNGSYMIFCSIGRPDSFGGSDLYISFRGKDGNWTKAKNMGEQINTSRGVCCPSISPDGRYLFFESSTGHDGDIYWVNAKIINEYKPSDIK